jgi:hypothetical protein
VTEPRAATAVTQPWRLVAILFEATWPSLRCSSAIFKFESEPSGISASSGLWRCKIRCSPQLAPCEATHVALASCLSPARLALTTHVPKAVVGWLIAMGFPTRTGHGFNFLQHFASTPAHSRKRPAHPFIRRLLLSSVSTLPLDGPDILFHRKRHNYKRRCCNPSALPARDVSPINQPLPSKHIPTQWSVCQPNPATCQLIRRYANQSPRLQAQTLEQRRRNAKFAKDQEARMGKSDDQIKKRTKETPKSPISPVWIS